MENNGLRSNRGRIEKSTAARMVADERLYKTRRDLEKKLSDKRKREEQENTDPWGNPIDWCED